MKGSTNEEHSPITQFYDAIRFTSMWDAAPELRMRYINEEMERTAEILQISQFDLANQVSNGKSVVDVAIENGAIDIVNLFIKKGAWIDAKLLKTSHNLSNVPLEEILTRAQVINTRREALSIAMAKNITKDMETIFTYTRNNLDEFDRLIFGKTKDGVAIEDSISRDAQEDFKKIFQYEIEHRNLSRGILSFRDPALVELHAAMTIGDVENTRRGIIAKDAKFPNPQDQSALEKYFNTFLLLSAQCENPEIIQLFFDRVSLIDDADWPRIICSAIKIDNVAVLETCIDERAKRNLRQDQQEINQRKQHNFQLANAESQHVFDMRLTSFGDAEARDEEIEIVQITEDDLKTEKSRIINSPIVNDLISNMLHIAATNGGINVAEFLVERCTSCEAVNDHGETALHLATKSQNGRMDLLNLILPKVSDTNPIDRNGETPLHLAIRSLAWSDPQDVTEVLELLLQHNANPLLKNVQNRSASEVLSNIPYENLEAKENIVEMLQMAERNYLNGGLSKISAKRMSPALDRNHCAS